LFSQNPHGLWYFKTLDSGFRRNNGNLITLFLYSHSGGSRNPENGKSLKKLVTEDIRINEKNSTTPQLFHFESSMS